MRKKHNLERVLEEGDRLFRTQGYHATGVDEILKNTEFPRSSFYYHFNSKEGFGIRTLAFYGGNMYRLMLGFFQDTSVKSPLQRIKNYFFAIADYNVEVGFASCCLIHQLSVEVGSHKNPFKSKRVLNLPNGKGPWLRASRKGRNWMKFAMILLPIY